MKTRAVVALALSLGLAAFSEGSAWATATCQTVVRTFINDPNGRPFGRVYRTPPDINQAGDVVFVTRAKGAKPSLYEYPLAGTPSVVVAGSSPAPNGGVFRTFTTPSINNAGDIGFFSKTSLGPGVFVVENGGALEVAGIATGASPGGGNFSTFPAVSLINSQRQIAYVATVSGGPNGVFRYDGIANTVSTVALVGGNAPGGRQFCSFSSVALADSATPAFIDSATTAFIGETQLDCSNTAETALAGVFVEKAGVIGKVAQEGDPNTPIGGTTYSSFLAPPDVNVLDHVLFRARVTGSLNATGAFLGDPNGPAIEIVTTGEIAPGTGGGTHRKLDIVRLASTDAVFLKSVIRGAAARAGIFRYAPSGEALLLRTDPPPVDLFGAGSIYRMFSRMQIADDGSRFVLVARVKDTVAPKAKTGVFRCTP
jgi:hypothetical protein